MTKVTINNQEVEIQTLTTYTDYEPTMYHPISLRYVEGPYDYPQTVASLEEGLLDIIKQLDSRIQDLEKRK